MSEPVFLYIEDDPLSRTVMRSILVLKLGYSQVTIFEDSTDFMARIETLPRKPDIIFLDIHMRPHSGFEVLKTLRSHQDYQDTTVIALTASVMSEEINDLKSAGFNGVIAKPLNLDALPGYLDCILAGEAVWEIT